MPVFTRVHLVLVRTRVAKAPDRLRTPWSQVSILPKVSDVRSWRQDLKDGALLELWSTNIRSLTPIEICACQSIMQRSVDVRHPCIRPVFRLPDQPCSHGIIKDIVSLISILLLVPQPMIKEISLPSYASVPAKPSFPFPHDSRERFVSGEVEQEMNMIGHQDGKMTEPNSAILTITNRFENNRSRN